MKSRTQILLALAVLLGIAVLSSIQRGANPGRAQNGGVCCPLLAALDGKPVAGVTNPIPTTHASAQQVITYYFHGTIRCETCLMIERLAKAVIKQQFSAELATNGLVFTSVNYELPENTHFLTDYKLPCPSLVLVRQIDGKDEKWKLLGETWQLVHDPPRMNSYVETEVRNFLSGQEQQTVTNQFRSE
jgi:hypothetical protein